MVRFGEHGPDDEQFNVKNCWAEPYTGPTVRCETCWQREQREFRAEVTVVVNAEEGTFVVLCVPCARRYAERVGVIIETAENRSYTQ